MVGRKVGEESRKTDRETETEIEREENPIKLDIHSIQQKPTKGAAGLPS